MKLLILILTLTMAFREGGLDLTPPTQGPVVDGQVIVSTCDRLVIARIKKVSEYDFVGGKPSVRIAELDLMLSAQPFGSKWERVLVRLVDPGTPPELAYWPLERNVMLNERDWKVFPSIEPYLKTEQLWMPALGLNGPWPVQERDGSYKVHLPTSVIKGRVAAEDDQPKPVAMEWIPQGEVHRAVVAELTGIEPRTEALNAGGGPTSWTTTIDGQGRGNVNGVKFQWTKEQRDAWSAALDEAKFATMPPSIGASSGPCGNVQTLSIVTREGRRSVRCYGPVKIAAVDRQWVPGFEKLWNMLRTAVPTEPK